MGTVFADFIGSDRGASPLPPLFKHWLDRLDLTAEFRRPGVEIDALAEYLAERQSDPDWSGCVATAPHGRHLFGMVSITDAASRAIGTIHCVVPDAGALIGVNLEVAGIEEALDRLNLAGRRAAIIGTGALARAAIAYLETRSLHEIVVLARSENAAGDLLSLAPGTFLDVRSAEHAAEVFEEAELILNTIPLDQPGPSTRGMLGALPNDASAKILFDASVVGTDSPLLLLGRERGARVMDGLAMLLGEARLCFELLFHCPAPAADLVSQDLLQRQMRSLGPAGDGLGAGSEPRI